MFMPWKPPHWANSLVTLIQMFIITMCMSWWLWGRRQHLVSLVLPNVRQKWCTNSVTPVHWLCAISVRFFGIFVHLAFFGVSVAVAVSFHSGAFFLAHPFLHFACIYMQSNPNKPADRQSDKRFTIMLQTRPSHLEYVVCRVAWYCVASTLIDQCLVFLYC